jgi:hypothetical protein
VLDGRLAHQPTNNRPPGRQRPPPARAPRALFPPPPPAPERPAPRCEIPRAEPPRAASASKAASRQSGTKSESFVGSPPDEAAGRGGPAADVEDEGRPPPRPPPPPPPPPAPGTGRERAAPSLFFIVFLPHGKAPRPTGAAAQPGGVFYIPTTGAARGFPQLQLPSRPRPPAARGAPSRPPRDEQGRRRERTKKARPENEVPDKIPAIYGEESTRPLAPPFNPVIVPGGPVAAPPPLTSRSRGLLFTQNLARAYIA